MFISIFSIFASITIILLLLAINLLTKAKKLKENELSDYDGLNLFKNNNNNKL